MKKDFLWRSFIATFFLFALMVGAVSAQVKGGSEGVSSSTIYGVTTSNQLIRFDSATPTATTTVGTITGLQGGEDIVGIDFRTATGRLYGLGSNSRLYLINTTTGVATFVATLSTALSGTSFGFDFNPTVDRIRIVSNTGQNLRVNPNNGAVTVDTPLNPGTPSVTAAGYTNSVFGATTTTLYVIDSGNNTLYVQNPPNNGTLVPVGSLGLVGSAANGFDIAPNTNTAYTVMTSIAFTSLYTVNLTTGTATSVGFVGTGLTQLRGMAIDPDLNGSPASVTVDFDGDRKTDYSVFRLSNSFWYINRSSNNGFFGVPFGLAGQDALTPQDYDGDGRTDIAVFRDTGGDFFVMRSSDNTVEFSDFGAAGDEPVPRDYDGDGRANFAVVRRTGNAMTWFVLTDTVTHTFYSQQFGLSTDVTAPGDYDGDGRFDLGVYRGNNGEPATFYVQQSTAGFTARQFGLGGDVVVPGDYDGDGRTDFAVVRQGSRYNWYVLQSSNNGFYTVQFGAKPHFTTQGDYDGDGRTDVSVYDPLAGYFFVFDSATNNVSTFRFGQAGDYPVANFDTH